MTPPKINERIALLKKQGLSKQEIYERLVRDIYLDNLAKSAVYIYVDIYLKDEDFS